jgi:adenosine kinase
MSAIQMQGAIVGMCNPLLDISADVPLDLLEKYGVQLNNAILANPEHVPLYDELVTKYPVQYIAGGAGQNSIRVAQWILQIPGATAFLGAVGTDEYGQTLEKCASEDGVLCLYQKNPEIPTGTCAVLINGGERSLVANLAAANTFSESHLDNPAVKEAIANAKIFYVTGFFLTVSVPSILTIAQHAIDNHKTFCMNLSAPFLIQFFGDAMASVMPYTDFVFGNESEAAEYGKAKGYGTDLATIALKLAAQPKASGLRPRIVVFTQGSSSTIVASSGSVETFPVDPLPRDLLVDTNGAGDAFVGVFAFGLASGKNPEDAMKLGIKVASMSVTRKGAQSSYPSQAEIETLS